MFRFSYLFCFLLLMPFLASDLYARKGEGMLAERPPMGWNSWNAFEKDIDENKIKAMADLMVSSGMKAAGYEFLVLDDAWMDSKRDSVTGRLMADPVKFPSGMKAIGDYIHSKGLKFGIYECRGVFTCQNLPGSLGHEELDMQTFADWGVDYIKMDACFAEKNKIRSSDHFYKFHEGIRKTGRDIVLSISDFGSGAWAWHGEKYAQLWRTSGDIFPLIRAVYRCAESTGGDGSSHPAFNGLWQFAGPGHWNDPDMLQVGNLKTHRHDSIHFALWSILSAPLMAGNDLRKMDDTVKGILTHPELIAVNQDKLGVQGYKFRDEGDAEIFVKPLSDGTAAVLFINKGRETVDMSLDFSEIGLPGDQPVRDLWERKNLGKSDRLEVKGLAQDGQFFVKVGRKSKNVLPMPEPLPEDRYVLRGNDYFSDHCYIQRTGQQPVSDRTFDGNKIVIGGKTYDKGLGCKTKTFVMYKLDKTKNLHLKGWVAMDPSSGKDATGTFIVQDEDAFSGIELFNSGKMQVGSKPVRVNVDLSGLEFVMLKFVGKGSDIKGVWGDLKVEDE